MSDSSNDRNSEEVASDEEPSVFFRNSEIKTLSNIMVDSGKKGRKTADQILTTVKQHSKESDDDDSYGVDNGKLMSNHKFKVYEISEAEEQSENEKSEKDSYQSSSGSDGNDDHFDVDGPVQLVKVSQDLSTFEVCEEGLKVLRSIKDDIGIVSLAGAQRTGKSFALNMLLDKLGGKGFKVSPSTASCTQGIWIWGKPTYVESRNMQVLLLDTEGSGSIDKNSTHDGKIFALVVLISSFFIYNSFGAIDENAINNLSLAAKLSKNIAVRAGKGVSEDEIIANFTPKFLWLLRDFVLELKENGHMITENEYLESKLDNYTEVKTALIKFFRMRELITMVRPVDDEYRLANLNNITYDKLRPQFRQKAEILKK